MKAGWIALIAMLALAVAAQAEDWKLPASCDSGTGGEECTHGNGGFDFVAPDKTQWIEVTTDSVAPLAVRYRMSRTPDDVNCEKAQGTELTLLDKFTVSAGQAHRFNTRFGRQFKPANALYEWHVCFLIEGTVYRAWHGFDPGPGATLNIHCNITRAQIDARDTDRYLCPAVEMKPAAIYSQFALHCTAPRNCKAFPDKASYDAWRRFNPLPDSEQDQMVLAVMSWEHDPKNYLGANKSFPMFLTVRGRDPSPSLLAAARTQGWNASPGSAYNPDERGMRVSISDVEAGAADQATLYVGAFCGRLCGGQESLTMKKSGDRWQVSGEGTLTVE